MIAVRAISRIAGDPGRLVMLETRCPAAPNRSDKAAWRISIVASFIASVVVDEMTPAFVAALVPDEIEKYRVLLSDK